MSLTKHSFNARSCFLSAVSWLLLVSAITQLPRGDAFSARAYYSLQGRRNQQLASSAALSTCEEEPTLSTQRRRSQNQATSTTTKTTVAATEQKRATEDAWSAKVAASVFEESTSPVLLFDGVCNLCSDAVNVCLDLDNAERFRFASLQSKVGRALLIQNGRDPNDRSTMTLVTAAETTENNSNSKKKELKLQCFTNSDAVLRIASELDGLPKPMRWSARAATSLVPRWFRDAAVKFVGRNRHLLGETDGPQCRLDLDGVYEKRFLEDPDLE